MVAARFCVRPTPVLPGADAALDSQAGPRSLNLPSAQSCLCGRMFMISWMSLSGLKLGPWVSMPAGLASPSARTATDNRRDAPALPTAWADLLGPARHWQPAAVPGTVSVMVCIASAQLPAGGLRGRALPSKCSADQWMMAQSTQQGHSGGEVARTHSTGAIHREKVAIWHRCDAIDRIPKQFSASSAVTLGWVASAPHPQNVRHES